MAIDGHTTRQNASPAKEQDLEAVFQIEKSEMAPDFYPRFFFRQALDIFGEGFVVAHKKNQPVGYIMSGNVVDEPIVAEIYSLVVKSSERGRGFGRLLMNHTIETLKNRKFKILRLSVSPKNIVAKNLYSSLGFKEISLAVDYFGRNEDRFIMEKVIQR